MTKENIKITCADGFELAATLYTPKDLKGAIMFGPATGIKRRFYNSLATYLAENGYGAICFDNRGIGGSIKGSINDINASLITWGSLDMPAVLEQLKASFPNQKYHAIGHSAGGQLHGLMHNAKDLTSLFNFAASSGNLGNMNYPFKLSALVFMNVFIPTSNFLFGVTNSQWMGMGEPLPKKVGQQWTKWCNGKAYVATDFGKEIKEHLYDDLDLPSRWLYAEDDGIANKANVEEMSSIYTASKVEIIAIDPKKLASKQLGHMGFFSAKNKELWHYALDWLAKFD